MEADRFTAIVQGNLLGHPYSLEASPQVVSEAYDLVEQECLRRKLSPTERDLVQRKLLICHLVNSGLVAGLAQEPKWQPFVGMYDLSGPLLFLIVREKRLWRYLIEAVLLGPAEVAANLVRELRSQDAGKLFEGDAFARLGIALAVIAHTRLCAQESKTEFKNDCLDLLGRLFAEMRVASSKGEYLTFLLFSMRMNLKDGPAELATRALLSSGADGLLDRFYSNASLRSPSDGKVNVMQDSISNILQKEFTESACVTVDDWISLLDCKTEVIRENNYVTFWNEIPIPSNLQYLVSHFAYECLPSISKDSVKDMLRQLAKKYEKDIELGLTDLTAEKILERAERATGWQLDSYLEHICKKMLPEIRKYDNFLNFISTRKCEAAKYIEYLYEEAVKLPSPKMVETFIEVLEATSSDVCKAIFEKHLDNFGLTSILKCKSFDTQACQFLNMAVKCEGAGEKETNWDGSLLYTLTTQDVCNFLSLCVSESINNIGKLGVVTKILKNFEQLIVWKVEPNEEFYFTQIVLQQFVHYKESEKNIYNLFLLATEVSKDNPLLTRDLLRSMLSHIVTNRTETLSLQGLLLVKQLFQLECIDFNDENGIFILLSLCSIIASNPPEPYKSLVIDLIVDNSRKCDIRTRMLLLQNLPDWMKGYFRSATESKTLLQYLNSTYRHDKKESAKLKISKDDISCIFVETLPFLIPDQWEILWKMELPFFTTSQEKCDILLKASLLITCSKCVLKSILQNFVFSFVKYLDSQERNSQANLCILKKVLVFMLALPLDLQEMFAEGPSRILAQLMDSLKKQTCNEAEGLMFSKQFLALLYLYPEGESKSRLFLKLENCFN